jgi:hypothetical protein
MKTSKLAASTFDRYSHPQAIHSRFKRNLSHWFGALLLLMAGTANAAVATVELQILNATDSNGNIVVVVGEAVEVGFIITEDPSNELDKKDEIQLLRVTDNAVSTYDVTFHPNQTFRDLWDDDDDGFFESGDGSAFDVAPTFYDDPRGAELAVASDHGSPRG